MKEVSPGDAQEDQYVCKFQQKEAPTDTAKALNSEPEEQDQNPSSAIS